ncbi:MAG: O-antigen ligase family protein [Tenuifilaceae bacterium]
MKFDFDFKNTSTKIFLLIAFFIPVWLKIAIPLLLIMLFVWFIEGKWQGFFFQIKKNIIAQIMIFFWLLHLIGVLYSTNWQYGLSDVQQKLSLLIFPIVVLGFSNVESLSRDKVLKVFLAGSIISGFICLINATINSISLESGRLIFSSIPTDYDYENFFKYERLSFLHHPTYLSMYFSFAILIAFKFYKEISVGKIDKMIYSLIIIFLTILIFLLNSRIGMITGFLVIIIGMVWLNRRNILRLFIASLGIISITSILFVMSFNSLNDALVEVKYSAGFIFNRGLSDSSEDMRLKIWDCVPNVMKNNYLFGHGTGDFHIVLNKEYVSQDMKEAYENNLNAHNQFLETLISLGLVGLMTLVFLVVYPIIASIKERRSLFFNCLFILIISLNFMTESILSRIGGVIFFSFFYCLLFMYKQEKI